MRFLSSVIFLGVTLVNASFAQESHSETGAHPVKETPKNDCTQFWREADWKLVPFPDTNAQYLSYQFRIPKGKKLALKFEGEFPKGVYSSFVRYDEHENSKSSLLDSQFNAVPPSKNPFNFPHETPVETPRFSTWAYSENLPQAKEKGAFTLPYDAENEVFADIWFRLYDETKINKIPPPKMTAFEFDGTQFVPSECPPLDEKEYSIATEPFSPLFPKMRQPAANVEAKVPMPPESGEIHFFWPDASSLGDNPHVRYAAARLPVLPHRHPLIKKRLESKGIIQNIGDMSVMKFKLPTSPDPRTAPKSITGKEDMRYWSICLSDSDTSTEDCLSLANAKVLKDKKTGERYAVLVVGNAGEEDEFKNAVEAKGYNFLDRSHTIVPILFYRQMLARPDFPGNIEKIKRLPIDVVREKKDASAYYAENKENIGGYAPTGWHCFKEDFLKSDFKMKADLEGLEKE